jgi:hypothetical protein
VCASLNTSTSRARNVTHAAQAQLDVAKSLVATNEAQKLMEMLGGISARPSEQARGSCGAGRLCCVAQGAAIVGSLATSSEKAITYAPIHANRSAVIAARLVGTCNQRTKCPMA